MEKMRILKTDVRKYKADLAYFKFRPKDYPTPDQARELYEDHSHNGIEI
jgi:hypothetical protein